MSMDKVKGNSNGKKNMRLLVIVISIVCTVAIVCAFIFSGIFKTAEENLIQTTFNGVVATNGIVKDNDVLLVAEDFGVKASREIDGTGYITIEDLKANGYVVSYENNVVSVIKKDVIETDNKDVTTEKPVVTQAPKETEKPVETTPVETKPAETKTVETTPAETTPAETKPAETKPAETKPTETKPAETKPAETKPAETKPVETKPVETQPAETKPAETKPVETKPAETKPVETKPAETKPVETQPAETKPAETKPVETEPVETEPVDPENDARRAGVFFSFLDGQRIVIDYNNPRSNYGSFNQLIFDAYGMYYNPHLVKNGVTDMGVKFNYNSDNDEYVLEITKWRESYDSTIPQNKTVNCVLETLYYLMGDKDLAKSLWSFIDDYCINGKSSSKRFGFNDVSDDGKRYVLEKDGFEFAAEVVNGKVLKFYFYGN